MSESTTAIVLVEKFNNHSSTYTDAENLARHIISRLDSVAAKLKSLEGDIRRLWIEFDNLKTGETILGCATKKEFCEKRLNRTPRAIQYLLAGQSNPADRPRSELSSPVAGVSPAEPSALHHGAAHGLVSPSLPPVTLDVDPAAPEPIEAAPARDPQALRAARLARRLKQMQPPAPPVPPNKKHVGKLSDVLDLLKKAQSILSTIKNVESIEEYERLVLVARALVELIRTQSEITKGTKNINRHVAEIESRSFKGDYRERWMCDSSTRGAECMEVLRQFKRFVALKGYICTGGHSFTKVAL
jgi:hypothetical protein